MKRQSVCIFCASSECCARTYHDAAIEVARRCVAAGLTIVYGAGSVGLMGDVADTAMDAGGKVVGVIPQFMIDRGWNRKQLTRTVVTDDMGQRKAEMRRLSDGIIALPGGCGTLEELLEAITQRQLGLYRQPIVVLNTNGYYDSLIAQLNEAVDEQFMRQEHARLWNVASTPEEAVNLILTLPDLEAPCEKRMLK
jgi:uncharacterized protein (TIGR00730 family)